MKRNKKKEYTSARHGNKITQDIRVGAVNLNLNVNIDSCSTKQLKNQIKETIRLEFKKYGESKLEENINKYDKYQNVQSKSHLKKQDNQQSKNAILRQSIKYLCKETIFKQLNKNQLITMLMRYYDMEITNKIYELAKICTFKIHKQCSFALVKNKFNQNDSKRHKCIMLKRKHILKRQIIQID